MLERDQLVALVTLASAVLMVLSLNACAARAVVGAGKFATKTVVKTGVVAVRTTGRAVGATARAVTD
jgi:hypothetical protein